MRETTIAIRDDSGVVRKVTKVIQLRDGFAVSVPYHSAREGWITEHPMHYEKLDVHTVMPCELEHFTASDRVKLSIHLDGFVQFSRGGQQSIRSGYDEATQTIKGVGLKAPTPVVVTSGPTFGIVLRGLEDFVVLPDGKPAEVFEKEDIWHHPRDSSANAISYHLEGFTFPIDLLREARTINGKHTLLKQLPFMSLLVFRHELRVIELPGLPVFIGLILSRCTSDPSQESGYVLSGPGCGPPRKPKIGISAYYPKPAALTQAESLDYGADAK